jgi:hypothetical protein
VATAAAYAYESAYLDVHVKAVAEATSEYCNCAEAFAFGEASFFKLIAADAYAEADAAACAKGTALP